MATKAKRREVYGPISRVRLRERRQSNGIIRALHLRLSGAREEIAQLKRDNAGLVEEADRRARAKEEELAKVKREYDVEVRAGMNAAQEAVRLRAVVVEQAKALYHWPALVKKEGG